MNGFSFFPHTNKYFYSTNYILSAGNFSSIIFAFKTSKCTTVWEQSYKHFKYALIWLQWSSMLSWTANTYDFSNNKWCFKTLKQSLKKMLHGLCQFWFTLCNVPLEAYSGHLLLHSNKVNEHLKLDMMHWHTSLTFWNFQQGKITT